MRVIKTNVIKKIPRTTIKKPEIGTIIIIGTPIYFEFSEKDLKDCLKKLQEEVPKIKNRRNRESWQRVAKTSELLLQDKEPNKIAVILGLAPSTIKRYLDDIDGEIKKNMTG